MSAQKLITENIGLWTSAIKAKNTQGRGSSKKRELYGINKLRELILELAVRGKLVPQDPKDKPVSVLLERIAEEKAQLIIDKKIKKQKLLPEITNEEKSFDLPGSWSWQRFAGIFYPISVSQNKVKTSEMQKEGKIPVVDQGQSFIAGYIDKENLEIKLPGPVIIFGDHTCSLKYIDFNFVAGADGVKILRPICCDEKYFYLVSKTLPIENRGYGRHYSRFVDNLFPLPPLEEQPRIVAKVGELMTLCDQLEQQTESSLDAHKLLVDALLSTLTNALDANELSDNWARLAEHFDTLITTGYAVEQLKQTILQLAVQGKLVPQDPTDEPASELLKHIAAEKEQLIKDKKIKIQKPLPEITDEEKPFDLPEKWEWINWGDILGYDDFPFKRGPFGSSLTKSMFVEKGYKVYEQYCPINDDCSFERYYITEEKFKELEGFSVRAGDYLVSCSGVTLGRITQIPKEFKKGVINQAILRVRINHKYVDSKFFKLLFRSPFFQKAIFANSTGSAIPNVKGVKELKTMPIPFLPIAEQRLIVKKVDQLTTLCDKLKTQLNDAQTTQLHLSDAVVENTLAV